MLAIKSYFSKSF